MKRFVSITSMLLAIGLLAAAFTTDNISTRAAAFVAVAKSAVKNLYGHETAQLVLEKLSGAEIAMEGIVFPDLEPDGPVRSRQAAIKSLSYSLQMLADTLAGVVALRSYIAKEQARGLAVMTQSLDSARMVYAEAQRKHADLNQKLAEAAPPQGPDSLRQLIYIRSLESQEASAATQARAVGMMVAAIEETYRKGPEAAAEVEKVIALADAHRKACTQAAIQLREEPHATNERLDEIMAPVSQTGRALLDAATYLDTRY